jgi:hypothetical protein
MGNYLYEDLPTACILPMYETFYQKSDNTGFERYTNYAGMELAFKTACYDR